LAQNTTTIGRASNSSIRVPLTLVSSKHCSIRFDPATRLIQVDDHSTNGTYIDGTRITKGKTVQVVAGQTISLGKITNSNQDKVPHYQFALIDPVANGNRRRSSSSSSSTNSKEIPPSKRLSPNPIYAKMSSIGKDNPNNTSTASNAQAHGNVLITDFQGLDGKPGVYYGRVDSEGRPHGRGVHMVYPVVGNLVGKGLNEFGTEFGRQFDGMYEHGKRTQAQHATVYFPDGKIYRGQVSKRSGKPNGFGCETRPDGDRYIG
jgi:hypothetical protein